MKIDVKQTGLEMNDQPFPVKTREFENHHFDSTVWNDFEFRDDDIIIGTYASK